MKILHVNFSDNRGGASISVMRLHKYLLDKGIDSNLLVSEQNLNEKKVFSISKTSEKLKNIIKSSISRNLKFIFKTKNKNTHSLNIFPSKLLKIINAFNADIVNLHWIGNETISISQISKINSKVVWTLHDMWPFCGGEHYTEEDRFINGYKKNNRPNYETGFDLNRYIWKKKKKNFDNIKKIICASQWMYQKVKESSLFHDKDIIELPLIIDQKEWCPSKNVELAKQTFDLTSYKKVIAFGSDNYTGNDRKGLNFFLDAVKFFENHKEIEFVIFGEDNTEKFNHYLKSLGINKKIKNLGKINDNRSLKLLYSAVDLIVSPSILESFGLIVYEALHVGTPSVIFENTGSSSIIQNKKNGYIAKFKSSKDLIEGIDWCLKNLDNKNEIYKVTLNKINSENIITKYLDFLKK